MPLVLFSRSSRRVGYEARRSGDLRRRSGEGELESTDEEFLRCVCIYSRSLSSLLLPLTSGEADLRLDDLSKLSRLLPGEADLSLLVMGDRDLSLLDIGDRDLFLRRTGEGDLE